MSSISGFFETENMQTLTSDYLRFSKYDGSMIIVKDSTGLPDKTGVTITKPLTVMYYVNPKRVDTIAKAIIFVTELFNQYSTITIGANQTTLFDFLSTHP
jgi:hypothetical protein